MSACRLALSSIARRLAMALPLVFALALAPPASATLSSYQEPEYTKGGSNTFWFLYQSQGAAEKYCWQYAVNHGGTVSTGACDVKNAANGASQNLSRMLPLASGSYYAYFADRYVDFSGWLIYPCADFACRATTTADLSQPAITTSVDGTAEFTSDPKLQIHIDYQDSISPPWFGPDNRASNWVGIARDATPAQLAFDTNCSVPNRWKNRFNSFDCTYDASAQPDGKYNVCVQSADAAVPDNPNGPDQFVATSDKANISAVSCGYVTLDRGAPSTSVSASASTAIVGQLITFSAQATDGVSGVSGTYDWDFGDNSAHGAGASVTHTFTQPGTYAVKVTTKDGAGNPGAGAATVVVNPAASGSGGTGGGTVTPGGTSGTQISQQTGGGGSQTRTIGTVRITAPRTLRTTTRSLPVSLRASSAGRLGVRLTRNGRTIVQGNAVVTAAGTSTLRLRLPKRLPAGRYALRLSWKPAGGRTRTATLRVTVKGAKRAIVSAATPRLVGAAPAVPARGG